MTSAYVINIVLSENKYDSQRKIYFTIEYIDISQEVHRRRVLVIIFCIFVFLKLNCFALLLL